MKTATQDPIQDAMERPRRYWNADGIPEIVAGTFWLAWGAAALLPIAIPNRRLIQMESVIVIVVIGASALVLPWLIKRLKERVTFPRTGYVELRRPKKSVRFAVASVAFTAALAIAAFAVAGGRSTRDWVPLILAILLSLGLTQMAWKMRVTRLAVLAPLVAAIGIATTALRVDGDLAVAIVLLSAGFICVADGLLVLRSYLRAHPQPAESGHE